MGWLVLLLSPPFALFWVSFLSFFECVMVSFLIEVCVVLLYVFFWFFPFVGLVGARIVVVCCSSFEVLIDFACFVCVRGVLGCVFLCGSLFFLVFSFWLLLAVLSGSLLNNLGSVGFVLLYYYIE